MTTPDPPPALEPAAAGHEDVVRYFEGAGPDYAAWSPDFNMHFGWFAAGMNPFRREPMLERMNAETLTRLALPAEAHVADLGCGLGATARSLARRHPGARVTGFTIVPWQVENGDRLSRERGLDDRVTLVLSDYAATSLPTASVDGAYAVESACYAGASATSSSTRRGPEQVVRPVRRRGRRGR